MIFGLFIAPIVRMTYRRLLQRFAFWLLGANLSDYGRRSRLGLQFNEGPFMIRIRANVQDQHGNDLLEDDAAPRDAAPAAEPGAALNVDGGVNPVANPNPIPNPAPNANDVPQDPNAANLAAAERLIEINASSLGRRVGGALLIPYISNLMGCLLFRLSKHSHILREFLGIKQHRRLLNGLPPSVYAYPGGSSVNIDDAPVTAGLKRLGQLAKAVVGNLWGGTKTWAELDPVWWRNSIGLGLFVVVRPSSFTLSVVSTDCRPLFCPRRPEIVYTLHTSGSPNAKSRLAKSRIRISQVWISKSLISSPSSLARRLGNAQLQGLSWH